MAHQLSHPEIPQKPSSDLRELDYATGVHLEAESAPRPISFLNSPQKAVTLTKRIPEGTVYGEIPLEAAKAYPIRIFEGISIPPRIAYADLNTHHEHNTLSVKLLPNGGKTAPHPQIVFFVNGAYHVESLSYERSNPFQWTTWMEFHLDTRFLDRTIDAMIKAKLTLEGIKA
jgi:hypothetical protein